MSSLANVVLFQIGWFASVLGASHGSPYLGPAAVAVVLVIHLRWFGTRREGLLLLASAAVGTLSDSSIAVSGLATFHADPAPAWLCPPWIIALWANLGITLRHSLRWLERRRALASLLGALTGPIAYVAGERLGAISFRQPSFAIASLAVLWALSLPFLLALSARLERS